MEYIVMIFLILLVVISFPTVKGFLGETAVKVYLSRLNNEKYKVINDVMIPNSKGKTSQIDHVIISIYGIFVIETKNYKGWIFGSEDSYQWKQVIYKRKEKLFNPIKQNWGHVLALKEVLKDYPNVMYYPIVTFSTRATLKLKNVSSNVVYNPKLVRTIRKYNTECISEEEVEQIYNTLI